MGPPEFTGGNLGEEPDRCRWLRCFNGAAGIHRRKQLQRLLVYGSERPASMGPPEFTGGNLFDLRVYPSLRRRLQWGRRNSPAETAHRGSGDPEGRSASMGPPEFTGGNPGARSAAPDRLGASMGPPEFTGGNQRHYQGNRARIGGFNGAAGIHRRKRASPAEHDFPMFLRLQWGRRNSPAETLPIHFQEQGVKHASMGPPEFTGGNFRFSRATLTGKSWLQWGRRNSPAETPTSSHILLHGQARFNGAAGIHRRKPEPHQLDLRRRGTRFNGAAGIHRRKLPYHPRERNHRAQASMGPPEFTGGNPPARPGGGEPDCASMGPPEFTGGNTGSACTKHGCRTSFNGAAGIHRRKRTATSRSAGGGRGASMGPPEFTGGNRRRKHHSIPTQSGLQWGRRNSPAETTRRRAGWPWTRAGLQWGRRNSPAETPAPPTPKPLLLAGFNGAAGIHRRKPAAPGFLVTSGPVASMGPPEFTGGNGRGV